MTPGWIRGQNILMDFSMDSIPAPPSASRHPAGLSRFRALFGA